MPIVKLKTVDLRATTNLSTRPQKKRVFTDDEWLMLTRQPDWNLKDRIKRGDLLIGLLYRPEMNINNIEADKISSNLRFQQEAIQSILDNRSKNNGRR